VSSRARSDRWGAPESTTRPGGSGRDPLQLVLWKLPPAERAQVSEESGRPETAWEQDATPGRPPRHLYRLAPQGAELVAELGRAAASTGRVGMLAPSALGVIAE